MAHRIIEYLERQPGVHVRASALTGRVLAVFNIHDKQIDDILAALAHVELPWSSTTIRSRQFAPTKGARSSPCSPTVLMTLPPLPLAIWRSDCGPAIAAGSRPAPICQCPLSPLSRRSSKRMRAVRDAVGLSILANITGAIRGFRGRTGVGQASRAVYAAALTALANRWVRFRGGERSRLALPPG